MKIARIYLRVSTDEQDLTRQGAIVENTKAAGFYIAGIYREKASGARADRPELAIKPCSPPAKPGPGFRASHRANQQAGRLAHSASNPFERAARFGVRLPYSLHRITPFSPSRASRSARGLWPFHP